MFKLFLSFFLIPVILFAEEQITPYLTSECDTLSLVEGVVNACNGKLVQIENDIHIEGPDPLEFTRYYDGGHHFSCELGYSMGYSFPLLLQYNPSKSKQNLYVEQRAGLNLIFNVKYLGKNRREGKIDPDYYKIGYTNCCEALLRGEPPIYAMSVKGDKNKFIVDLGNGTRRHYEYFSSDLKVENFRLVLEEKPSGNNRHFSYLDKKSIILKRVWTTNKENTLTLNFIDFTFSKDKIIAEASNGQKVTYYTEMKKGKAKRGNILSNYTVEYKKRFMTDVEADHLPSSHYDPEVRTKYVNTILSINKVTGPDGRSLHVDYNKNEWIKNLYLSHSDTPLYMFDYHSDYTTVTDARGDKKKYQYTDKRLTKLKEGHRIQTFDWSNNGKLESHVITDPNGNQIIKREYQYDPKGNITRLQVSGNITKKDSKDSYYIRYIHSQDERNLLLSENHNDEHEITYGYHPNSQLLTSKHTFADQSFVEKEFMQYDKNGILTQKIIDDGNTTDINDLSTTSTRLVTEIEAQLNPNLPGMALPRVIRESYIDPRTEQKHLLKKVERIYTKGDLLAEEKTFDSQENYRYSQFFEYNSQRKIVKSINAIGETTLYGYDANHNKIYEEKIGTGKKTHYVYDTSNRLIEEIEEHTDGTVLKSTSTYDLMGNRIASVDSFNQKTTFEYDLSSREIAVTDPLGYVEKKAYDALNNVIEQIDKDGHKTKTIYNIYGSPLEIQYVDGTTKRFTYNLQGHLVKERERDGTFTTYQVDYLGRSKSTKKYSQEGNLLKAIEYVYKGKNLISTIDGMGHITQYFYDGAGRKISEIDGDQITNYTYDTLGRQSKITKSDQVTILKYDHLDRVIQKSIEDLQGHISSKEEYVYDIHGNKTVVRTYSDCNTCSEQVTLYNSHNYPEKIIDPLGNETKMTYLFTDHLERTTIDSLGRSVIESFDPMNRLKAVKTISASATPLAESFISYDGRGNKIHQEEKIISEGICLGSYNIHRRYDSMGQKIEENEQNEKITHFGYRYGRLETITNPDGVVITHLYDPLGRLQEQISSDGTVHYRFSYDLNDNVIQAEDVLQQTMINRSYDTLDRLIYERQATGFEICYSYDNHDRLKEIKFENNRLVYTYSPIYLSNVSRYKDGNLQYSYSQKCDWRGKPLVKTLPNNNKIDYEWDKLGRCRKICSDSYSQSLIYDPVGNLITASIKDPMGAYETNYVYDELNQLLQEEGPFSNDYTNDSLNNRRSKNELDCNINTLNQLVDDTVDTFTYDPNGRRLQKNNAEYKYDALGRLTSYTDNGLQIIYLYDPFGRLIKKNEQVFKYQFDTEIGSQNEFRLVLGKGTTLAMEINGTSYFPVRNHRGDICVVLDGENNPLVTYRYDAFGAFIHEGCIQSPWLFSSQRYDSVTNLYHYDKREYDPAQGRWLTPDPLGFADGPNLYAYVQNNPLIYVDPYGLWRECLDSIKMGTKQMGCSYGRGIVDDSTFGASTYMLGEHDTSSWCSTIGYYSGVGTSVVVGLLYGSTWIKGGVCVGKGVSYGAKYGGNVVMNTFRWATNYFKGGHNAYNAAKGGKCLNETHKIAKIAQETGPALKNIGNTGTCTANVAKGEVASLDALSEAGQVLDRGNLTMAGRALDKHGGRPNSAFPKATGNPSSKNAQGQFHLDDILTDPKGYSKPNKFGGVDYYRPDGTGARFYGNKQFRGFLEPDL